MTQHADRLRSTTIERVLVERPAGMTAMTIAERLTPVFDVADVLEVLHRRGDRFYKVGSLWRSHAVDLAERPLTPRWAELDASMPLLRRPPQAQPEASGHPTERWRPFTVWLAEQMRSPIADHFAFTLPSLASSQAIVLHVDHTAVRDRPAWVIWGVSGASGILRALDLVGLQFWMPADRRLLSDGRAILDLDGAIGHEVVATLVLRGAWDAAQSITYLLAHTFGAASALEVDVSIQWVQVDLQAAALRTYRQVSAVEDRRRGGPALSHCAMCGRPLTDPNSAAMGYGPECAARVGKAVIRALTRPGNAQDWVGAITLIEVRERIRSAVTRHDKHLQ